MPSTNATSNVERRTWDKETYEARARERKQATLKEENDEKRRKAVEELANKIDDLPEEFVPAEKGAAGPEKSQRAFLKARRRRIDLESKLGTSEIIAPEAAAISSVKTDSVGPSITDGVTKTGVGWHCKVCDCFLKDSLTYLDHINGRKHQKYLGFSMRVEKSTASQVREKMAALAAETEKTKNQLPVIADKDSETNAFEEMVKAKDEEALKRKAERARKREERKKQREEEEEQEQEQEQEIDPDMAAMMGFSGFGGGNKNR